LHLSADVLNNDLITENTENTENTEGTEAAEI
jgi:hypothetical protein